MLRREGLGTNDVEKCKALKIAANSAYQSMKKKAADFLWDCRHNKAETTPVQGHLEIKKTVLVCERDERCEGVDEDFSVSKDHLQK